MNGRLVELGELFTNPINEYKGIGHWVEHGKQSEKEIFNGQPTGWIRTVFPRKLICLGVKVYAMNKNLKIGGYVIIK